jgi:hypothetical protein
MKLVELDEGQVRPSEPPAAPAAEANQPGVGKRSTAMAPPSEIDLAEVDRILAEEERQTRSAKPPRATPGARPAAAAPHVQPGAAPLGPERIEEGRPFDEYYVAASVPASAYPAEKLLKVLDGLKALDPVTRKAAVLAMDAAEESWSVADVVLDAQRKLRVLTEALKRLDQQVTDISSHTSAEKDKLDAYLMKATETIHRKIAEAEHTLQNETAQVMAHKARLDSDLEGAAGARDREAARVRSEMRRLYELCSNFAVERAAGA